MKSPADFVQPPRIAARLVNLFIPSEEAESIPGDLLEEFYQLASKSGARSPEAGIGGKLQKPSHISPPPDFVLLPFRPLP